MIISASRRTDIPTYYTDWFMNRIREGFVCVRNPMNIHQVSRVALTPDVVDAIVFWTKNPVPMLPRLDELKTFMYYFQFTLNAYGKDVEAHVPSKRDVLVPAFRAMSGRIGAERVIWRYDPIFLTPKYTIAYHVQYFEELARRLSGFTHRCVISFLDFYRNTESKMQRLSLLPLREQEMREIALRLAEIAHRYHMTIESCAEQVDLAPFGIEHGHCIDRRLLESLLGQRLDLRKDSSQREACGCVASVDIGMYHTCMNGCAYCYANATEETAAAHFRAHDPASPLLYGSIGTQDRVTVRKVTSCRRCQLNLFDEGAPEGCGT